LFPFPLLLIALIYLAALPISRPLVTPRSATHPLSAAHTLRSFSSVDQSAAISAANAHASNGNENASLFSSALSHIGGINPQNADVDEDEVKNNHQQAYGGNAGNLSANAMGR
jgi:hypothetical protein